MSTLMIDLFSSLDGFGAAEEWPGYWGKEGPELMAWLEENLAEDHVIVIGANTYRTMAQIVADEEDPTFARMPRSRSSSSPRRWNRRWRGPTRRWSPRTPSRRSAR